MEDIPRKLCELAELPEDCEDLVSHIRNPEKTCDTCARYKPDLASAPKSWATCSEKHEVGKENAFLIHVSLNPFLKASQEMKT